MTRYLLNADGKPYRCWLCCFPVKAHEPTVVQEITFGSGDVAFTVLLRVHSECVERQALHAEKGKPGWVGKPDPGALD